MKIQNWQLENMPVWIELPDYGDKEKNKVVVEYANEMLKKMGIKDGKFILSLKETHAYDYNYINTGRCEPCIKDGVKFNLSYLGKSNREQAI